MTSAPPPAPGSVGIDPLALASTRADEDRATVLAHRLARRRLLSAVLHGHGRSWLDRTRAWPAIVVGVVVVAVVSAAIGITAAFVAQRRIDQEQQRNNQPRPAPVVTSSPRRAPSGTTSPQRTRSARPSSSPAR